MCFNSHLSSQLNIQSINDTVSRWIFGGVRILLSAYIKFEIFYKFLFYHLNLNEVSKIGFNNLQDSDIWAIPKM